VSDELLLSRPRGIYPTLDSARDAARRVQRGFVVTRSPTKHVVFEALWTPVARGALSVDVEPDTAGEWRVILSADDQALVDHGVIRLAAGDVRWLSHVALPAAGALLEQLMSEHAQRASSLRWNQSVPRTSTVER